jgi:hypothetical protein
MYTTRHSLMAFWGKKHAWRWYVHVLFHSAIPKSAKEMNASWFVFLCPSGSYPALLSDANLNQSFSPLSEVVPICNSRVKTRVKRASHRLHVCLAWSSLGIICELTPPPAVGKCRAPAHFRSHEALICHHDYICSESRNMTASLGRVGYHMEGKWPRER